MDLPRPLEEGTFLRRLNRFAAQVRVGAQIVEAHLPNSGRLGELLVPGVQVHVHRAPAPLRKTDYDLLLVRHGRILVSIDSRAPACIAAEAFATRAIPPLPRVQVVKREIIFGEGRIDLLVQGPKSQWLVEVKGCTLVKRGSAMFPDAPTVRGRRQVGELGRFAANGGQAMVLFVIQRSDAREFRPNVEADPEFAHALAGAASSGVLLAAYTCRVSPRRITLWRRVPIRFE